MKAVAKMIGKSLSGVILGVAALFLLLVAVAGVAFVANMTVSIPGVVHAWFTSENGLPAFNFEPKGSGMLIFILTTAIMYVFFATRTSKKVADRRRIHI